jgi:hypothetical protein
MSEALRLAGMLDISSHHENHQAAAELRRLAGVEADLQQARNLCERLMLEAQGHAQEACTANATIAEIYQAVSGGTGEPGNWHGAKPVVDALAQAREERTALLVNEQNLREELAALRASLGEPVAWVNSSQLKSAAIARDRGGQYDSHMWNECTTAFFNAPLYAIKDMK